MTSATGARVIVAGAGVTGLTVALALAKAGARVTVCDPAPLGRNASGVAAGMLAPAFETALDPLAAGHFALLKEGRDLWPALADEIGIVLDRSGAVARGDAAWLADVSWRLGAVGAEHIVTDDGVFSPEDWRLDSGAALVALRDAAGRQGVTFVQRDLRWLTGESSGIRAGIYEDEAEGALCDVVVQATGWAGGFAPEAAHLTPIKGHILKLAPLIPPGPVIRGDGIYLCPNADALIVGATMEAGVGDAHIDPGQVMALRAAGARLLPEVARASANVEVGVRATTPDGLPLVGRSALPGLILASGLRRNGWLLAPLVAEMVAACVLGRDPGPWAHLFDPRRFDTPET
jgi:glycine oxidase